ncbi:MAG: D-alanine--D-alanine ligase A [Firmicutes bacterium ADurb.Bin193]|nr:MAG: D-alanine--D-alanine ligase A [Firmicutes bacterium ADurb.Bin193]
MSKQKVCVIFGGNSSEHEVSRVSARNVINNLDKNKYEVYPLGITKEGQWLLYSGDISKLDNGEWEKSNVHKAIISPDSGDKCILVFKGNTVEKINIDVAFLILHGRNGEDGTVQGLLQLAGIPYTGSGVLSSALCMDKASSKLILEANGIPQARWLVIRESDMQNPALVLERVEKAFSYPVFVKPSGAGSSIGAGRVLSPEGLIPALEDALRYDTKALVEENINAREIECGIIGNDNPRIALLGEVVTDHSFYDFEAKYTEGAASSVIPAPLSAEKTEEIKEIARKAYLTLECKGFVRIDFFVEKTTERVFLNEINSLPGCTDSSMFPVLWQKSGLTFTALLDEIISYAMEG